MDLRGVAQLVRGAGSAHRWPPQEMHPHGTIADGFSVRSGKVLSVNWTKVLYFMHRIEATFGVIAHPKKNTKPTNEPQHPIQKANMVEFLMTVIMLKLWTSLIYTIK